jgi:hypothetical protein
MRDFLAVLQREVVERRLLLLAAGLSGLFPLVFPYLRGSSGRNAADLQGAVALIGALIFSTVLAILLGGSVISRDLAERRLSFYFSRPLSGWAIWAGKMAATALLVLGSGALVLLPAWLAGATVDPSGYWGGGLVRDFDEIALGWAALVVVLILAAHAASVMMRSRSPWLLFDLVALGLAVALIASAGDRLLLEGAFVPANRIVIALVVALPLALLAASLFQVIRGRTDLRQGHRWLSVTLWSLLLVFGLASVGYAHWVVDVGPEDLEEITRVKPAPAGSWIVLEGEARHWGPFSPTFLVDTSSGRSVRLRAAVPLRWPHLRPEISADGRRAVWLARQHSDFDSPVELMTLDLTRPEAVPVATPVTFPMTRPDTLFDIALSPDGSRLASLRGGRLLVDEVSTGRTLVSLPLPGRAENQRMMFLEPDLIRVYLFHIGKQGGSVRTEIYEADLGARKLTRTGGAGRSLWDLDWSEEVHERIPVRDLSRGLLHIHDGRTGEVLATLPASRLPWAESSLLTRGRLAVPTGRRGSWDLKILAQDGSELRRFHFDGVHMLQAGPQPGPDHLVAVTRENEGREGWRSWLLDLESGASRLLGEELVPVSRLSPPGDLGSKLFLEGGDRLVRLDPLRGGKRVVLDLGKDQ